MMSFRRVPWHKTYVILFCQAICSVLKPIGKHLCIHVEYEVLTLQYKQTNKHQTNNREYRDISVISYQQRTICGQRDWNEMQAHRAARYWEGLQDERARGGKKDPIILIFFNINQRSLVLNNGTYQNIVCACISFTPQHFSTLRANSCELLYCLHSFVQFNCGKRKESKQFFFVVVRYLNEFFEFLIRR